MSNETKLSQQANRGDRARAILEDDLVVEAFEKLEQTISEAWKSSLAPEKEQRDNAYLMHRLLQNFRDHFKQLVITGDGAKRSLTEIRDPSKLRRIFPHG